MKFIMKKKTPLKQQKKKIQAIVFNVKSICDKQSFI